MAEPIAIAISTVGLLVPIVQVLQGSIKVADLWSARGLNYPRQPTAVERHIRTTYGDFVYMLLKLYLPGVTDQMEHIDGDVLHNGDEVIHEFRKSYVNDCNMTSVAGAIITQVAITALSLPALSQTHWVARACFVISLVSGTLSVFFAVLLQRTIGTLYEARSIRIWLSNVASFPSVDELCQLRDAYQELLRLGNSDRGTQLKLETDARFSAVADDQEKQAVASLLSALVLDMPRSLINLALGSFLTGLAVYFGFLWTRNLDTDAGSGDSRAIFIVFIIAVFCCISMYSLPAALKESDENLGLFYRRVGSMIMSTKSVVQHATNDAPRETSSCSDFQRQPSSPHAPGSVPHIDGVRSDSALGDAICRAVKAHEEAAQAEKHLATEYTKILASLPERTQLAH